MVRTWEVTPEEEQRVKALRSQYMKYGKKKLKILYQQAYHADISTWKIERVVRKHHLYPDPVSQKKRAWMTQRRRTKPKQEFTNSSGRDITGLCGIRIPLSSGGMGKESHLHRS